MKFDIPHSNPQKTYEIVRDRESSSILSFNSWQDSTINYLNIQNVDGKNSLKLDKTHKIIVSAMRMIFSDLDKLPNVN